MRLGGGICGPDESAAAQLGLENTHFTNCTGLFEDPDHYTSALDIAVMSRELLGHEFIRQYTNIWMDTIRNGEFGLTNTNKLVYYYDGCTGLKTGFTSTAMFCLSASAMRDGVEYIAVILHGDTSQARFDAAQALLDYAFANYTLYTPAPEEPLAPVAVELGVSDTVQPVCGGDGAVLVEKALREKLSLETELAPSVSAPVEAGQVLGSLTVRAGDQVLARVPLVAEAGVERLTFLQVWTRLARCLLGQDGISSGQG